MAIALLDFLHNAKSKINEIVDKINVFLGFGVLKITSVFDTAGFSNLEVGTVVNMVGYHDGTTVGGGRGVGAMAIHNGGTIISKTRTRPDWDNEEQVQAWLLKGTELELCFVRDPSKEVYVTWFGAIGDFNRTTGAGSLNLYPIQSAINHVASSGGGKLILTKGYYYLSPNYQAGQNLNLVITLLLGSITSQGKPFVNGVHIVGEGANLVSGNIGRMLHIARAKNCSVSGLGFYHYTGGPNSLFKALATNCIRVSDSSENIYIYNNYLTNYLAWGIDILSDAEDPTSSNYMVKNINIYNNTIKTRYGDGYWMARGWQEGTDNGTMGGWVIAVINGEDITIRDNVLYGTIDMENNDTTQTFYNISIFGNDFRSGWVTPQATVPSVTGDNWHDEPTNPRGLVGASEIPQGVYFVGVGLNNKPKNISVDSNTFEWGELMYWSNYIMSVTNNKFNKGRMWVGYTGEGGSEQITEDVLIKDNICDTVSTTKPAPEFPDVGGFIVVRGLLVKPIITDNTLVNDDGYGSLTIAPIAGNNAISKGAAIINRNTTVTSHDTIPGIYRVFIDPILAPSGKLKIDMFVTGGGGAESFDIICSGIKTGASDDLIISKINSLGDSALIDTGVVVKDATSGTAYIDITFSVRAGVINISNPEGHVRTSVVKIG